MSPLFTPVSTTRVDVLSRIDSGRSRRSIPGFLARLYEAESFFSFERIVLDDFLQQSILSEILQTTGKSKKFY